MAQSRIVNLLSVQRRPTQSSIEILSITRLTNHVSISRGELRDTTLSDTSPFRVPLVASLQWDIEADDSCVGYFSEAYWQIDLSPDAPANPRGFRAGEQTLLATVPF